MSDERREGAPAVGSGVVSDAAVYGLGMILQRGMGFLLLPFLTRTLGAEDYGRTGVALAVAAVLAILFNLGLGFSIVRLYYDEPADAAKTRWAGLLWLQVGIAALLASIAWLSGPYWGALFNEIGWGTVLQAAVAYGFALAVQQSAQSVLRAARRPTAFMAVSLVGSFGGGLLGLYLAADEGAAGYLGGLAAGAALACIVALVLSRRKPSWERASLLAGIALSVPFVFHQLSSWVVELSDRLLIERFVGLRELASYQVAYTVASITSMILASLNSAWAPSYFAARDRLGKVLPVTLLTSVTWIAIALSGALVAIAPLVVRVAAPSGFGDPRAVLALITAATSVRACYLVGVTVLFDAKDTRAIAGASLTAAAVNVGLNLVLIPRYGIAAAAATTLFATAVQTSFVLRRASGLLGSPLPLARITLLWLASVPVFWLLALIPLTAAGNLARGAVVLGFVALGAKAMLDARNRYRRLEAKG